MAQSQFFFVRVNIIIRVDEKFQKNVNACHLGKLKYTRPELAQNQY